MKRKRHKIKTKLRNKQKKLLFKIKNKIPVHPNKMVLQLKPIRIECSKQTYNRNHVKKQFHKELKFYNI